jgi:hypothetical protein
MKWFLFLCIALLIAAPLRAQTPPKPFILPMQAPPSPETWLLGQPYGNTIGAFIRGDDWYSAGQRLHFGVDFSMPCGTPLVAVADGEVAFVDDLGFGSGPHNLILRFPSLGLTALYGHLLERPPLAPAQPVRQGDLVGYSGDPDLTCDSRPHLHFEVRALDYFTAYNPVSYIDANWHALAAIGAFRYPQFQQDLDDARRWLAIEDQPDVAFGGRALNRYAAPYPDLRSGQPPVNPPLMRDLPPISDPPLTRMRRLAFDGCCHGAWWDVAQPNRLYTIDGTSGQRASVFAWDTDSDDGNVTLIGDAPPPTLSPDGTHELRAEGTQTRIRRRADSAEWTLIANGAGSSVFNADSSLLMWQFTPPSINSTPSPSEIWLSDANGTNARAILRQANTSAQWLDATRLLIVSRERQTTTLFVYNVLTGENYALGAWERLRALSIAPGGGRIAFYLAFQGFDSGVYTIETQPAAAPQRLSWFGAWMWRDANSLYYLPFDPASPYHGLHLYDVETGADQALIRAGESPFVVANGDWTVSPDGDQIAFMNALDYTLWLIDVR